MTQSVSRLHNPIPRQIWLIIFCLAGIVIIAVTVWVRILYTPPGYGDEGYQALCVTRWEESPMAMYSFWKASQWIKLFGDSFVSLRVFVMLIVYTGVFIIACYVWCIKRSLKFAAATFIIAGLIAAIEAFVMYNWDGAPTILYALGAILSLEYLRKQKNTTVILLAIISALLTLSRLQLIVLPVFALLLIIFAINNNVCDRAPKVRIVRSYVLFIAVYITGLALLMTLMSGSPIAFVNTLSSDNIVSGHSLRNIGTYVTNFGLNITDIAYRIFPAFMVVVAAIWLTVVNRRCGSLVITGAALIFAGTCMTYYVCDNVMDAATSATIPVIAALAVLPVFYRACTETPLPVSEGELIVISFWYLTPCIGSDMFICRLNGYLMLPLLLLAYSDAPSLQRLINNLCLCLTIAFGASCVMRCVAMVLPDSETVWESETFGCIRVNKVFHDDFTLINNLRESAEGAISSRKVCLYGGRYMYAYAMNRRDIPYLHKFHLLEPDKETELSARIKADYDAWIFIGVSHYDMQGVIAQLEANGFVCVYDNCDPLDYRSPGHMMYLRAPYVGKWLSQADVALKSHTPNSLTAK